MFTIVEARKASYVIRDDKNGGKCCATAYTLLQLLDAGCIINGIKKNHHRPLVKADFDFVTVKGNDSVPDTKRSAKTIMGGLKPAKAVTVKKPADPVTRKRIQVSKVQLYLYKIDDINGEYHGIERYYYRVRATSAAAITAMRKLSNEMGKTYCGFFVSEDAAAELKRRGYYETKCCYDGIVATFDEYAQVFADETVRVSSENSYEDTDFCETLYAYNAYRVTNANRRIGPTASSEEAGTFAGMLCALGRPLNK